MFFFHKAKHQTYLLFLTAGSLQPSSVRSSQCLTNVLIQCVVDREFPRQTLLVADSRKCKSLGDGAQSQTFRGDVFLTLHVSPSNDQRETLKGWLCQFVILENRLKRTALSPVIQLHLGKPICVEGSRFFFASRFEKLVFRNEKEFRLPVNEAPNEPRASDPVHFDIASCNPLHISTLPQEAAC